MAPVGDPSLVHVACPQWAWYYPIGKKVPPFQKKLDKNSPEDLMAPCKPLLGTLRLLVIAAVLGVLIVGTPGQAQAGGWFKAAGGLSGMAMEDINNGDFRFYDTTINGYNFPDLNSGFSMSFHVGFDFSPDFSLGFSWDKQHGHVKGTDVDITADLKLDANLFMTHVYWSPLRAGSWSFGAAGGLGLIFPNGTVKLTGDNNVNYGEGKISGSSSFAFEIMALANWAFGGSSSLETTIGWRIANLDEIKLDTAPVYKEDGSNLELDYTGYIIKVGYKFVFGDGDNN
jgi:hypothetical protein